jgi:hypothetical protein
VIFKDTVLTIDKMDEKNPVYAMEISRPRGLTTLYEKVSSMRTQLCLCAIFCILTSMFTMGLVIAGNEMTKEMWVTNEGIVVNSVPVATHQSVATFDFDDIVNEGTLVDHLNDMKYVTLRTPDWVSKHTIESWVGSDVYDYFQVNTTDGNTLTFNGTFLGWNEDLLTEFGDTGMRALKGFNFKKFVKQKLDSPMCNTEALLDKFRSLKFVTTPACHVGVSGAKIYMHYRDN